MKKRYIILVVLVFITASFSLSYYEWNQPLYPVYDGENLLKTDAYPFTFAFFGDNRPRTMEELKENLNLEGTELQTEQHTEQPEVFVKIIQMINEEDPLFVIG